MTRQPEFDELTDEQALVYCAGSEKQRVRARCAEIVGPRQVLDLGCGNGIDAERYATTQYVGIDRSPALIRAARHLHPRHTFACRLDAHFAAYRPAVTVIKSVLEHLASEADAIGLLRSARSRTGGEVLVAWHTPPVAEVTQIRQVPGHCYQDLPPGTWERLALAQASGGVQVIEDAYAATAREL